MLFFSEDCKGSVWKSWEGGDDVEDVYSVSQKKFPPQGT